MIIDLFIFFLLIKNSIKESYNTGTKKATEFKNVVDKSVSGTKAQVNFTVIPKGHGTRCQASLFI
ncbi:MAG: hypothetical protein LBK25_07770 [Treponema sp.]|nr:hypothetical protein [Treponema sp.]